MNASKTKTILMHSMLGWTVAALIGILGIPLALIPGFPIKIAAQATAGIIGLVGGLSYSFLVRMIGGRIAWGHILFLSVTWGLCFVFGITPLFHTSGSPAAMMTLTFCSFAVFGAFGGMITARLIRLLHAGIMTRDPIPSIGIWSFSFGLAAVVSNVVGEALKTFLPEWLAWLVAFEAMALMIGGAGGLALMRLIGSGSPVRDAPIEARQPSSDAGNDCMYIVVLIMLCLPFYLNDFTDIYVKDWRLWLAVDYIAVKLIPFLIVLVLIRTKRMEMRAFGLNLPQRPTFLAVFFLAALSGVVIDQIMSPLIDSMRLYPQLGRMPEIASTFWRRVDLTAGLLMVAVAEEIVFRGYLRTFIRRYTERTFIIVVVSAVAFGAIHWSGGFDRVLVTSVVGAIFMLLYIRTDSLPAIMLAHFMTNFIDFGEYFPKFAFGSL